MPPLLFFLMENCLEDKEVVPISALDQLWGMGKNWQHTFTYCFVFDGKLDPIELRSAFFTLAERKYRILGARLRTYNQASLSRIS